MKILGIRFAAYAKTPVFMRVSATVPHITMDSLKSDVNAENTIFFGFNRFSPGFMWKGADAGAIPATYPLDSGGKRQIVQTIWQGSPSVSGKTGPQSGLSL